MTLYGGPWNGKRISDSGKAVVRMSIASKWKGNRPDINSMGGLASYEPSEDRENAFWQGNEWDGKIIKIIEA